MIANPPEANERRALRRGQVIEVSIAGLDDDFVGYAEFGDAVVSVAGTAPGDVVRARIDHISPHTGQAWGSIVDVLERGEAFVRPACHHAHPLRGDCGGCPAMHLTAEAQRDAKRAMIARALERAQLSVDVGWHAYVRQRDELAYRNRTNYVYEYDDGRALLGSYKPRSHEVAKMDGCLVVRPPIAEVAAAAREILRELEVPSAREEGGLRYLSVRANDQGEALVQLIGYDDEAAWRAPLFDRVAAIEGVVGVAWANNESRGNVIRTETSETVRGRETIRARIGPVANTPLETAAIEVDVGVDAFLQLNEGVAAAIYTAIGSVIAKRDPLPEGGERIVDLYCGVGAAGLIAAQTATRAAARAASRGPYAAKVRGLEVSAEAVARGRATAARAGVAAELEEHDLTEHPPDLSGATTVIVNPPRRGLDAPVVAALSEPGPTLLAYVSCSPDSFAADAAQLRTAGWSLASVTGYDMLPQTAHVEMLGVFER